MKKHNESDELMKASKALHYEIMMLNECAKLYSTLIPNMLDDPQKMAKKINQYFLFINFESLVTMFWFSAISDIFKFSLGSLL